MKHITFVIFTIAVAFGSFITAVEVTEYAERIDKRRWNNVQQSYDAPKVVAHRKARDGLLTR